MKSRPDTQLNLPPMPVQPSDRQGESARPESGLSSKFPEITLEMAKAQIGRALRRTITGHDSALKEFGDPSQVRRVCEGDIPNVIARVWQRDRAGLVKALGEESGLFHVRTTMTERKRRLA